MPKRSLGTRPQRGDVSRKGAEDAKEEKRF